MHNKNTIHELIREFYPWAKEELGFNESCKVFLRENRQNCADPLGKTAYYDPQGMEIHLYITMRHPKDVLRSFSHELVHHNQNCQGELQGAAATTEGYAQTDEHLRKMEKQAYLRGGVLLRDWCDTRHGNKDHIRKHHNDPGDDGAIKIRNNNRPNWVGPAGDAPRRGGTGNGGWST